MKIVRILASICLAGCFGTAGAQSINNMSKGDMQQQPARMRYEDSVRRAMGVTDTNRSLLINDNRGNGVDTVYHMRQGTQKRQRNTRRK